MTILLVGDVGAKPGTGIRRGGTWEGGRCPRPALISGRRLGRRRPEPRRSRTAGPRSTCSGAGHRGPEAETGLAGRGDADGRGRPAAAVRGTVDGAVVLGEEIVEHAEREDDGERQDRDPFHINKIIPRMPGAVNKPRRTRGARSSQTGTWSSHPRQYAADCEDLVPPYLRRPGPSRTKEGRPEGRPLSDRNED
ncbi:MAG: hypothetical protein M0C28_03150 [Candidatus Moduliflexus flocculans]|nr:hypothetical protein [Candidatus Moduliflexus flocculans]